VRAQSINDHISDENYCSVSDVLIISKHKGEHWHSNDFVDFIISELNLPDTLIISHMGYEKKEVLPENAGPLLILLKSKSIEIGEVSVNGDMKSLHDISQIDLHTKPVNSSHETYKKNW